MKRIGIPDELSPDLEHPKQFSGRNSLKSTFLDVAGEFQGVAREIQGLAGEFPGMNRIPLAKIPAKIPVDMFDKGMLQR